MAAKKKLTFVNTAWGQGVPWKPSEAERLAGGTPNRELEELCQHRPHSNLGMDWSQLGYLGANLETLSLGVPKFWSFNLSGFPHFEAGILNVVVLE